VYAADVCSCVLLAYVHTRDCKQNTLLNNMLRFYATPELQSKYFAAMTTSKVASFALSEPGSGSDAFALTTTATLSADKSYYTLEGQKMWISNAEQAEIFFVFATVDRAAGYKGITCFIVDKEVSLLQKCSLYALCVLSYVLFCLKTVVIRLYIGISERKLCVSTHDRTPLCCAVYEA
jgi:Acyl-CoA dehydrogenase, middle domain